tara:strand:- start:1825 stop:2100 length:276 start_codon:yes stop_codon:yes gene_type:complete
MELMNILKENCDPKKENNAKLPYNAYLVQYVVGEESRWDLTMCHKQSDIFDHYYDKYKKVLAIVQSEGKVSPKLWRDPNELKEKPTPKKRK